MRTINLANRAACTFRENDAFLCKARALHLINGRYQACEKHKKKACSWAKRHDGYFTLMHIRLARYLGLRDYS